MRAAVVRCVVDAHVGGAGYRCLSEEMSPLLLSQGLDVEHDEFGEFLNICERAERRPPVHIRRDICCLEGSYVE